MRNPRPGPGVAFATATILLAACQDQPESPFSPPSDPALQAAASLQDGPVYPSEEPFIRLAQQVPGFGGYFYDETGNLVAYLTDLSRAGVLSDARFPV